MIDITIEEYKERIPTVVIVDDSNNFDPMSRYNGQIKTAKKWIRKNILGDSLMDFISASAIDFDSLSIGSENNVDSGEMGEGEGENINTNETMIASLIELVKDVLIFKSYLSIIPYVNVSDTGSGLAVVRNEHLAPASKERTADLTEIIQEQLNDSCDDLFEFLENQNVLHQLWKVSRAYSLMTDTLIPTYAEFVRCVKFDGDRFGFIKLRPAMQDAILFHLRSYLSLDYIHYIINSVRNNEVSEHDDLILPELKLAYANFVMGNINEGIAHVTRVQSTIIAQIDNYPLYKESTEYEKYLKNQSPSTDGPIFKMHM